MAHDPNRHTQSTTHYSEQSRLAFRRKCEKWTAAQAERLGYTTNEIMEAITRGAWLPEQIEALAVAEAADLEGPPPCSNRESIAKIRAAPVLPIHDPGGRLRRVRREPANAAE